MLRRLHTLIGYQISATDDGIGSVNDFYFDDQSWTVRYIVIDTGPWLFGRRLLVSTDAIAAIDSLGTTVNVDLTKAQVENSPDLDLERPFTREQEIELHNYYGWPGYWTAMPMAGTPTLIAPMPIPVATTAAGVDQYAATEGDDAVLPSTNQDSMLEPNLRSLNDVRGYYIAATDGDIGHVADFFAAENDWIIRYMEVDTRNWLPGKHVLVGVDWVTTVDWVDRKLNVKVNRQQVKDSPEYDPQSTLERVYEDRLYEHYLFPTYWGV